MKASFLDILKSMPVFRLLLSLVAGILIGIYIGNRYLALALICCISFMGINISIQLFNLFFRKFSWIRGVMVCLNFMALGVGLTSIEKGMTIPENSCFWYGELTDFPVAKKNSCLLKVKINSSLNKGKVAFHGVNIYLYTEKGEQFEELFPGEKILFYAELESPVNPGNPEEFDYAHWLLSKDIPYQCYLKADEWTSFPPLKIPYRYLPLLFRHKLIGRIRDHMQNVPAGEVLMAITLGSRELLEKEIKQSYANAGVIHVMAVSGLHVGMIWMFLNYLFFFLKNSRFRVLIKFFIVTSVLWAYAVMTGLSPSVSRACLMFTLAGMGGLFQRDRAVFNMVLLAAFIQLLMKPSLIMEVGFQFSYAAVFSILLFHKPVHQLIGTEITGLRFFTNLIAVSISAQILTFPLVIFYFHQFPSYFILTNLLIIPLVTALMIVFLSSVAFYLLPLLNKLLIELSLIIANLMNHCVQWIESFPGSVVRDIAMDQFQLLALLAIPLLILFFSEYKKSSTFLFILCLVLMQNSSALIKTVRTQKSEEFIVYNIPSVFAAGFKKGRSFVFFTNSEYDKIMENIEYACANYWIREHYPKPQIVNVLGEAMPGTLDYPGFCIFQLPGEGNLLVLNGQVKVIIMNDFGVWDKWATEKPLKTDFLIAIGKGVKPVENFILYDSLIIASSLPNGKYGKFRLPPDAFDVTSLGAYRMKWNEKAMGRRPFGIGFLPLNKKKQLNLGS